MAVSKTYIDGQYADVREDTKNRVSIINVCVRQENRGCGIGDFMLKSFIAQHRSEDMELCVLKDNIAGVKLYQKNGFKILSEFPGFSLAEKKPMCFEMLMKSELSIS